MGLIRRVLRARLPHGHLFVLGDLSKRIYTMSDAKKVQIPRSEIEGMADELAKNARLQDPLPADTDLSAEESKQVQDQVPGILLARAARALLMTKPPAKCSCGPPTLRA